MLLVLLAKDIPRIPFFSNHPPSLTFESKMLEDILSKVFEIHGKFE